MLTYTWRHIVAATMISVPATRHNSGTTKASLSRRSTLILMQKQRPLFSSALQVRKYCEEVQNNIPAEFLDRYRKSTRQLYASLDAHVWSCELELSLLLISALLGLETQKTADVIGLLHLE
jgi:hypothetical protein